MNELMDALHATRTALIESNRLLIKNSKTSKDGYISDDEACRARMNARAIAKINKQRKMLVNSHIEITPILI